MTSQLSDRYVLEDVVGSGGMGTVHRATDTRLGRTVAVKILNDAQDTDEVARARLRNEAKLAASVQHPGVAQVFDHIENDGSPGASSFIVMEYVEGQPLTRFLRDQGQMAPDQVMSIVQQVAEGLQAAHDAGIVHRDLKPANIMLTPAGRTVLVDFGIAKDASSEPLTDTGELVGTADQVSPEQVRGRPATPQSDLYALGVVAYQCLTGSSPFRRETHIGTAMAHLNDELPDFPASVPADVRRLVTSMTSKEPEERPLTAAAVAEQAAAIGAAERIDLPETFQFPPPPVLPPRRRRRPRVVQASVGVALALLAFFSLRAFAFAEPPVVPDVVGMTSEDATRHLQEAGLTPRAHLVDVAGTPAGSVVTQRPISGATASDGDPIDLQIASGKVRVRAGEFVGLPFAKASAALEELGFVVKREDVTRSTGIGDVVALDRTGRLRDGATVTLSVARAPEVAASVPPATTRTAPTGGQKADSANRGRGNKGNNGAGNNGHKGRGNNGNGNGNGP